MGLFGPRYTVRYEHTVITQTKTADGVKEERQSFAFDGELSLTETALLLHEAKLVHQADDFVLLAPPAKALRLK
jgi:hypothetical protein